MENHWSRPCCNAFKNHFDLKIVQITPGAGGMYCGGCFHDNTLVAALRQLGHPTTMVPLYLPLTLDEANESTGTPIFFSGINVYLDQKIPFFRKAPGWLHRWLASPRLLRLASGAAARTRPEDVGDLTLSMLRGEEGNQARELEDLIAWLKTQERPEIISLSNALLIGMGRRLKSRLDVPVVCLLQGEDSFLDSLPERNRAAAWDILAERAREVDRFIAPSRYYGELMGRRLRIPAGKIRVVPNGIHLDGFGAGDRSPASHEIAPVLGFFARMCRDKGLDRIVDTFVFLREGGRWPNLKLRIGGGCGPADEPGVHFLRELLKKRNLLSSVEFFPNVDRTGKIKFLQSLTVFCTPAMYGEAFGLYVIEAMAAGVPVVQPRHGAFPEIVAATGGGIVTEPEPRALAAGIEELLTHPEKRRAHGEAGRRAVLEKFNAAEMARATAAVFSEVIQEAARPGIFQS